MRRVVVTGIGAVTPVGNNVPEFWEAIKNGKNGIALITRFDVSESKYKLAAEVKEFDPTKYMDKLTAKKLDRFVQFAMVAAGEAMTDSQLEGNIEKEDLAVYFGSGIGGFETLCESYDLAVFLLCSSPRLSITLRQAILPFTIRRRMPVLRFLPPVQQVQLLSVKATEPFCMAIPQRQSAAAVRRQSFRWQWQASAAAWH